ncbi:MAG: hypothetical protein WC777_01860 [Candidatus Gracilibacteria bacterium]|jgi:hypothetical protein
MKKALKVKICEAISFIAHPVFVFPLLTVVYFKWDQLSSFLAVLGLSFVMPFLYFLYLYKTKRISDFDVSKRIQRYPLYYATLIGLMLSIIYLYLFSTKEIFYDFSRLLAIATLLILFNFKIKVSIHVALITILCFALVQDFNLSPLIFLTIPLVVYSRLLLKRHKPLELILGFGIPALFYIC